MDSCSDSAGVSEDMGPIVYTVSGTQRYSLRAGDCLFQTTRSQP